MYNLLETSIRMQETSIMSGTAECADNIAVQLLTLRMPALD